MNRRALLLPLAPCLIVLCSGCPWTTANPHDPTRCDPRCDAGEVCHEGRCVEPDAGRDGGSPDAAGDAASEASADASAPTECGPLGPADGGPRFPRAGRVRFNTAVALPGQVAAADLDGDGVTEWVVRSGDVVTVARMASTPTCRHRKSNIIWTQDPPGTTVERIFVGRFRAPDAKTRAQLCASLSSKTLRCYSYDFKADYLAWAWDQTFDDSGLETIVGDFDDDDLDELMYYRPSAGNFKLRKRSGGAFQDYTSDPGVLGTTKFPGRQVLAANLIDAPAEQVRDDLLLVDPARRRLQVIHCARKASGVSKWVLALTTKDGFLGADEQVVVANLRGGVRDQLVLRDTRTGAHRFLEVDASGTKLVALGQAPGDLPSRAGQLLAVKAGLFAAETGGRVRTDLVLHSGATQAVTLFRARQCHGLTHLKAFSHPLSAVAGVSCP